MSKFQHTALISKNSVLGKCAAGAGVLLAAAIIAVSLGKAAPIEIEPADDIEIYTSETEAAAIWEEAESYDRHEEETSADADESSADDKSFASEAEQVLSADVSGNGASSRDKKGEYFCVYVKADGKTYKVKVREESTVGDILDKVGIDISKNDELSMSSGEIVTEADKIVVDRVEYETSSEVLTLDYDTEYRDDDTLPAGTEEVLVNGCEGEVVVETLTKYVNGEAESSEVVDRNITKYAVDEIILRGTLEEDKPAEEEQSSELPQIQSLASEPVLDAAADGSSDETDITEVEIYADPEEPEEEAAPSAGSAQQGAISLLEVPSDITFDENGIPVGYTKTLTGQSCAYTASPDALMSTGKTVFQGYVAVDPDIIPYGTRLYIVADDGSVYGYAIAGDTGYSVRAGHIIVDLFMNEYDDCILWGRRNVTIYVLD